MTRALVNAAGRLPWGVLYAVAAVGAWVLHSVVRYRRRIVLANLEACFPDKSDSERRSIAREFYRRLAQYAVETVKLAHISDGEMRRRMVFEGADVIDRLLDQGRSVTVYFAHTFNWEWAPSVTLWTRHAADPGVEFAQIYRPLRSAAVDRLMLRLRSRFGSRCIAKTETYATLSQWRRQGVQSVTGFMSDQHPRAAEGAVETMFLNRSTRMLQGTETLSRRLHHAAVYWDMERTGRGRYRITVRHMCDDAADTPAGQLTRRYAEMLQTTIRRDPPSWLWTHNRWK